MDNKIQRDFIDELPTFRRDKDTLIDNDKIYFTCDVCQRKAEGSHLWVQDPHATADNGRQAGYDWLRCPDGWLTLWTENGPIHACSKMCAIKLNTDLFYED
jgi:hypothetical protein